MLAFCFGHPRVVFSLITENTLKWSSLLFIPASSKTLRIHSLQYRPQVHLPVFDLLKLHKIASVRLKKKKKYLQSPLPMSYWYASTKPAPVSETFHIASLLGQMTELLLWHLQNKLEERSAQDLSSAVTALSVKSARSFVVRERKRLNVTWKTLNSYFLCSEGCRLLFPSNLTNIALELLVPNIFISSRRLFYS